MKNKSLMPLIVTAMLLASCDRNEMEQKTDASESAATLQEVALMLSSLPMEKTQVSEVFSAVSSSASNGYDEEYTMDKLFHSPGCGVGDSSSATKASYGGEPYLKDLIREYLEGKFATKAGKPSESEVQSYVNSLIDSGIQIYWPFSENWDGEQSPVLTFNPYTEAETNIGFTLDGEQVEVSEDYAREHPVWIVNVNDDSGYLSYEMLLRQHPEWGQGGDIHIGTNSAASGDTEVKSLRIKGLMLNRSYESWFGGASELMIKCGSIENLKATDELDLNSYSPSITDFMVVVRRKQLKQWINLNVLLVSDWTEQLDDVAFMMVEDDGGTSTSWKMETSCKINSKSYGLTINLPCKTKDDIVWRGRLSRKYLEANSGMVQHFGESNVVLCLD